MQYIILEDMKYHRLANQISQEKKIINVYFFLLKGKPNFILNNVGTCIIEMSKFSGAA
jgi:hypothetical protein